MKTKFIASLFSLLIFNVSFAVDITPKENLGQIKVTIPDLSGSATTIKHAQIVILIDGTQLQPDTVVDIAANTEHCLEVSYYASSTLSGNEQFYSSKKCGIKVKAKTLTQVDLAAVELNWNQDFLSVELGARPDIQFSADATKNESFTGKWNVTQRPPENFPPIVTICESLTATFTHTETGDLYTQTFSLTPGQFKKEAYKVEDYRATLSADLSDGPAFLSNMGRLNSFSLMIQSSIPAKGFSITSYTSGGQSYQFPLDRLTNTDTQLVARMFPYSEPKASQLIVYLAVNEQMVMWTPKSKETFHVPIATLNVYPYESEKIGVFRVFSNKEDPTAMTEYFFKNGDNYVAIRGEMPTSSTLFFPYGLKYRLDFYISDKLKNKTLEDQIEVDLTQQP